MKANTEEERRKNRKEAREKAEEFMRQGNGLMAQRKYAEAVDITGEIAREFIEVIRGMGVEYYVAPYEADAQLAYLHRIGRAHVVITEDSDLLIFGVTRVMFKMDKSGNGIEVDLSRLSEVEEANFKSFTLDMLLTTCILSGCDYLDSIKGIGFKKAHRLVFDAQSADVKTILKSIRREGKYIVPADYERHFEKALLTFKFQLIYCPLAKALRHLHDPDTHELGGLLKNYTTIDYLGRKLTSEVAQGIAKGEINPNNYKAYEATTIGDGIEVRRKVQAIITPGKLAEGALSSGGFINANKRTKYE